MNSALKSRKKSNDASWGENGEGNSKGNQAKTTNLISVAFSKQVKYAPKVLVTVIEGALDTGRIPEGNSIKLHCKADANPQKVTYRWYINDDIVVDATLNELVSYFFESEHRWLRTAFLLKRNVDIVKKLYLFDESSGAQFDFDTFERESIPLEHSWFNLQSKRQAPKLAMDSFLFSLSFSLL